MKTTHRMRLQLGDISFDGHGQHNSFLIETNHSVEMVRAAYENSCKLTNFDFDKICSKFEDNAVSIEDRQILTNFGMDFTRLGELDDDYRFYDLEEYVDLWFQFVRLSLPMLEWKIITDDIPNINGGQKFPYKFGYGLFN